MHIVITVLIMLIVSRFIIRIVDATVQIDRDMGILVLLLIIINSLIGFIGYRCWRRSIRKQKDHKEQAPGQR